MAKRIDAAISLLPEYMQRELQQAVCGPCANPYIHAILQLNDALVNRADELRSLRLVLENLTSQLAEVTAKRDALKADAARWKHWRKCWRELGKMQPAMAAGIDLTRVYIDSPEKLDERTDAAIDAAREGK